MALSGSRTYVGFGFGPIQAGLFLYEAYRSGNFGRLVVAEVVPEVVAGLRRDRGYYDVHVAHLDRVETARVGPVEALNPAVPADRERLVAAVAEAQELATAIPNVDLYATDGPGSLHRILAAGFTRKVRETGPRAVVYCAENHNRAAEILEKHVRREAALDFTNRVQFLNTVIGKMSGVVEDAARQGAGDLSPPGLPGASRPAGRRVFLVESFNRILISRVVQPPRKEGSGTLAAGSPPPFSGPFERGIAVFEEKADLLPFEEAKLYGHNAVHALGAYLGRLLGVERMADLRGVPGMMAFLREAFLRESGAPLIARHHGIDPLFTETGYADYADDLLTRMTNPFLRDTVERVGRDPRRKLGWDDRLVGTMRLALAERIEPRRFALGAAAAFAALDPRFLESDRPAAEWASPLWAPAHPDPAEEAAVLALIERARTALRRRPIEVEHVLC